MPTAMPPSQHPGLAPGRRDRRSFLKTVGRAGLAAAGAILLPSGRAGGVGRQPLVHPLEVRSENGILRTTITASPGPVQLGDYSFPGLLYNGAYLPPVLRPRLGDTMRITFR